MILFSYIPEENWTYFYDKKYFLEFKLHKSDNIKLVQFQIKDVHQNQFIDLALNTESFCISLNELSPRSTWEGIYEICFCIFADDEYIIGEKGFIEIENLQLIKKSKNM